MSIKTPPIKREVNRGDGLPIHPGDGIIPILKQVGERKLKIIGTGFYITRYGLFLTAKHVLEDDVADFKNKKILPSFVWQLGSNNDLCLRPIRQVTFHNHADLAIGHADNFIEKNPDRPIMNLRGILTTAMPKPGDAFITYAYPENAILDFNDTNNVPTIKGNFFNAISSIMSERVKDLLFLIHTLKPTLI